MLLLFLLNCLRIVVGDGYGPARTRPRRYQKGESACSIR